MEYLDDSGLAQRKQEDFEVEGGIRVRRGKLTLLENEINYFDKAKISGNLEILFVLNL